MAEENGIRREALIKAIDKVINQIDEGIKKSTLVIPRGYQLKRTIKKMFTYSDNDISLHRYICTFSCPDNIHTGSYFWQIPA